MAVIENPSVSILLWDVRGRPIRIALRCFHCDGTGRTDDGDDCDSNACLAGWIGILPHLPTTLAGGKAPMLQSRYAAGEALFHADDDPTTHRGGSKC